MGCVCVGNKMIINPKLNQNKLQNFKLLDKNWKKILNYLSKNELKEVGIINKYFHNLISELNYNERKTEIDDKNSEILKYHEKIKKQNAANEKLFLSNNNDKININYEFENKKIYENKKNYENKKETINFSKNKKVNGNLTMSPILNFKKLNIENTHSKKTKLNLHNSIINNKYLNTETSDNEKKIGPYFDIFTNMKIYVYPKNNQFQNSSLSNSSLSYIGTPTFSDYSNNKSIINSNISNHYKFTQINQINNNSYVQKENIFPQNTKKNINKYFNI